MKLLDHQRIVSFLETHEVMVKHFCDAKDGGLDAIKPTLTTFLEQAIAEEELRVKLTQDEAMKDKMIAFHKSILELLK